MSTVDTQPVGITVAPAQLPMSHWLRRYQAWLASNECVIKDKRGNVVPLRLNSVQLRLLAAMCLQADTRTTEWPKGRPIRIIVLKARKHGVSTLAETLLYFFTRAINNFTALTVAHSDAGRQAVFGIAARTHTVLEGLKKPPPKTIAWPGRDSRFNSHTAAGRFVATADTVQALHVSELAKCQSSELMDKEAIISMLNAVPQAEPFSVVLIESTGQGPSGEFYDRCMAAQAGRSDYILMFFPWFDDPTYEKPTPPSWKPDAYGEWLIEEFDITPRQVAWYDWILHTEQGGDRAIMRWEYPSTVEEAFEAPSGRVYAAFSKEKNQLRVPLEKLVSAKLYRGIDWGDTEAHPTAVVWIAHWADRKPRFTVDFGTSEDPKNGELLFEFQLYRWNPKTGQPAPENDHLLDAIRYVVTTYKLTGHVHVYRVWKTTDGAKLGYDGIAKEIHRLSGWAPVRDAAENDLREYRPRATGFIERFAGTVADRSRPLALSRMNLYGIEPCIGWKHAAVASKLRGGGNPNQSRGPVRDGISWLTMLIRGQTAWDWKTESDIDLALSDIGAMRKKWGGRPVLLDRKTSQVIKVDMEKRRLRERIDDEVGE